MSNKYASYELLQLGELDYMQFELLASEVRKDSVHFEIALWACIWYYGSSDWWNRKPIPQSCIYQNNKFNLLVVEVQQQFFSEINKKSQRGLYKVKKKFKQLNKVNDTINITFKKENDYNFIFEFGDFKSRYIQLESK
ncbi:MAG: hypothetical protein GQ527_06965 [Bacteroidales bacterium]|nr:hypothetical protein [Bacteroidales bacterium]